MTIKKTKKVQMLYFHFCQRYLNSVSREVDKVVRERVAILRPRDTLRGAKGIFTYSNVYVLQIVKPSPMRVIIQEDGVTVNDERISVFFIQGIVKENDLETYTDVKNGHWAAYFPISEGDKQDFIRSFLTKGTEDDKLEDLPSHLVSWLSDYKINLDYDIYETQKWVEFAAGNGNGMRFDDLTAFKMLFRDMVEEKPEGRTTLNSTDNSEVITQESREDLGIVYSRIEVNKKIVYLLHGGALPQRQPDLWKTIKQDAIQNNKRYNSIDEVGKLAQRAYPSRVLKNNDDLWKNIQKISEVGNLSLLNEQIQFLNNFVFPTYIDGQAGSGKSTILHYAFSNVYYYKCLGEIKGDVIFLTENNILLEKTKRSVRDVLRNNPANELTEEYLLDIDSCFSTLKDFLYAQLKEDEDRRAFPIDRYLDFPKFKERYANSYLPQSIKDEFTPEFVWFVITTYIEGYDLNYNINSENYDEKMPRGDRNNITKENFAKIEKEILPFYNRLIHEENYWDKIKIIKHINKHSILYQRYEVVFCDEAQDFSRIELKFIISLSKYLQYDISTLRNFQQGIPVVMAGDAFQTVNPTGFKKAEVKTLFYSELNRSLDEKSQYNPEYNYRSSQAIVNLANAVQFFRKKKFEIQGAPQKAKRPQSTDGDYLNIFIDFDALLSQADHYISQLEHKTIIIPVDSYEKSKYVEVDNFLHQYIERYNIEGHNGGNHNYDLVRTSSETKGVDYPQVVIYGFGKHCIERFGQYNEIENTYEARFFLNKLYVALTRAQEELIIIDEVSTFENFWKELLNDYAHSDWQVESEVELEAITNSICPINADNAHQIKRGTSDIELDVARNEKEQALIQSNPDLMRLAASRFAKLGKLKDYYLCKAEEAKLKDNVHEAIKYYKHKEVGVEGIELVANLYWETGDFESYRHEVKSPKNQKQRLQVLLANWLMDKIVKTDSLRELEKNAFELEKLFRNVRDKDKKLGDLAHIAKQNTDREQQILLIDLLRAINHRSSGDIMDTIAHLQYKIGRYREAIETWEQIGVEDNILYMEAKVAVAKQDEQHSSAIEWLGELLKKTTEQEKIEKEIIEIYEKNRSAIGENHSLAHLYVLGAYLVHKRPMEALETAKTVENLLSNKKKTLIDYYRDFLKSKRLSDSAHGFVLERWAKSAFLNGVSINSINEQYRSILEQETLTNPFTKDEINAIPERPNHFEPILPEHIKKINIKGFRKFKDVAIENLALFNLVVGDNNIGKTSLLEAFLFTPDAKKYLKRLGFAYVERKNIQPDKEEVNGLLKTYYSLDRTILKDFVHQSTHHLPIQFTFEEGRHKWKYIVSENGFDGSDISGQHYRFGEEDFKVLKDLPLEEALQQPFMPYGKGFGIDLATVYSDEIAPHIKIEKQFVENLSLFIPDVSRIRADSRKGDIFILQDGREEEVPLHQFGEGANKLFRILSLLTLHKGKRVMIDEIDAGIHYSRFKEFWKIILRVSSQNNTQIIATTHNEECIEYFTEALAELGADYSDKARVVQCKMVADMLKIRSYDFENFNFAQDKGIELRGGSVL